MFGKKLIFLFVAALFFSVAYAEETNEGTNNSAKIEKAEKVTKSNKNKGLVTFDFEKTSLTFIMGDDNLRDNSMYSPKFKISSGTDYDDFADSFAGYSNRTKSSTHLTLFHKEKGLLPHFSATIGLAFNLVHSMDSVTDNMSTSIVEGGSFLELAYSNNFLISARFYPYNADKIALGFFPGMKWGTMSVFPQNEDPVPGAQILFASGPMSVYAAIKTHAQPLKDKLNTEMVPMETIYGVFAGSTYDDDSLKIALQGAFIDKGDNVNISETAIEDSDSDEILSYGVDLFAEYKAGSFIGEPLGLTSYSKGEWRDPDYTSRIAYRGRIEGSFLGERLANAEYLTIDGEDSGSVTKTMYAYAGAAEGSFRYDHFRFFGLFSYRSLEFLVFDAPGVSPFETIPEDADTRGELAFSFNADYNVSIFWLGLSGGYKIPATYKAPGSNSITVIKDRITSNSVSTAFSRTRESLPEGEDASDILFAKILLKAKFTESLSTNLEFGYTRDKNMSKLVDSENSAGESSLVVDFDDSDVQNVLSLFFSVEGRF